MLFPLLLSPRSSPPPYPPNLLFFPSLKTILTKQKLKQIKKNKPIRQKKCKYKKPTKKPNKNKLKKKSHLSNKPWSRVG